MATQFIILGCGSSGGVPRVGGEWGNCDPLNPKNRRRRCSILVRRTSETGSLTNVLIDTSPDLRAQALDAKIRTLDGVLFTHDHADHTHGIDDLRFIAYRGKKRIDVYLDDRTGSILKRRFDYCFETPEGSEYPAILRANTLNDGEPVTIEGEGGSVIATPFKMTHGRIEALGFRIGDVAYCSDVSAMPDVAMQHLQNLDVLILNALRYEPHPNHLTLNQSLALIKKIAPKRAVLTHMHTDLDYETLQGETPQHVEPAFDGMVISTD